MKRILLTVLALLLIAVGLALFFLGIRGFLAAADGILVSPQDVGLYAPPTLWIGAVIGAMGIILLTFRKHY